MKKNYGKGYASLAIREAVKIAKKMGIKKLEELLRKNIGSRKALEKNKFKLEGKLKSEYVFMNKTSQYLFGRIL